MGCATLLLTVLLRTGTHIIREASAYDAGIVSVYATAANVDITVVATVVYVLLQELLLV